MVESEIALAPAHLSLWQGVPTQPEIALTPGVVVEKGDWSCPGWHRCGEATLVNSLAETEWHFHRQTSAW